MVDFVKLDLPEGKTGIVAGFKNVEGGQKTDTGWYEEKDAEGGQDDI